MILYCESCNDAVTITKPPKRVIYRGEVVYDCPSCHHEIVLLGIQRAFGNITDREAKWLRDINASKLSDQV